MAVIADALVGPAEAMRKLSGMATYPFCVTPFPVGPLDAAQLDERAVQLAAEAAVLLTDGSIVSVSDGGEPAAIPRTLDYTDHAQAIADFHARGWTDGGAVVVPEDHLVDELLAATGRSADEVVVRIDTRNGLSATVRDIAVNAVMAGCRPEWFDLVLTVLDAMADPAYNLHAHTATMAGAQQV
ncbi:MAG: hypothetical protein KDB21_01185, partial [Acidimicrobiales bacterium]|nr:hypothetical protein [Acidimicrobiales bacterium]